MVNQQLYLHFWLLLRILTFMVLVMVTQLVELCLLTELVYHHLSIILQPVSWLYGLLWFPKLSILDKGMILIYLRLWQIKVELFFMKTTVLNILDQFPNVIYLLLVKFNARFLQKPQETSLHSSPQKSQPLSVMGLI